MNSYEWFVDVHVSTKNQNYTQEGRWRYSWDRNSNLCVEYTSRKWPSAYHKYHIDQRLNHIYLLVWMRKMAISLPWLLERRTNVSLVTSSYVCIFMCPPKVYVDTNVDGQTDKRTHGENRSYAVACLWKRRSLKPASFCSCALDLKPNTVERSSSVRKQSHITFCVYCHVN